MQNSDKYVNNNIIEFDARGLPFIVDDSNESYHNDVANTKRKNLAELPQLKKTKILSSSMEIYNKKQKICNEIKDVLNPTFKINNKIHKKTKTLQGIIDIKMLCISISSSIIFFFKIYIYIKY